jgi:tetratricopeptide (TPR) repeat protein
LSFLSVLRRLTGKRPDSWPAWKLPSLGNVLDETVESAERNTWRADWLSASIGWECVRALARAVHGPGDARVYAAQARLARCYLDDAAGRTVGLAVAPLAAGALEGLRAAEGGSRLAGEIAFAQATLDGLAAVAGLSRPPSPVWTMDACFLPQVKFPHPADERGADLSLLVSLFTRFCRSGSSKLALRVRARMAEVSTYRQAMLALKGEPAGGDGARGPFQAEEVVIGPEEARRLLLESSEGLDRRPGRSSEEALEAKMRLIRFLMGESVPYRVILDCPERVPREEDLRQAIRLCGEVVSVMPLVPARGRKARKAGGDCVRRLYSLLGAARCHASLGEHDVAAGIRREAAESQGEDPEARADDIPASLMLAQLRFDLGESAFAAGRGERAFMMHAKALACRRSGAGGGHRLTVASAVRTADGRVARGEHVWAAALCARSAETLEAEWPRDPEVPELRFRAGRLLVRLADTESGLALMKRGADGLDSLRGEGDIVSLLARDALGTELLESGDVRVAARTFRKIARLMKGRTGRGSPHPDAVPAEQFMACCQGRLAISLAASGDLAGALKAGRRDVKASRGAYGREARETLNAQHNLARLMEAAGDRAGALRLHRQTLNARERVLGSLDRDTALSAKAVKELLGRR